MHKTAWAIIGLLILNAVPAGAEGLDAFLPHSGDVVGWTTYQWPRDEGGLYRLIDGAGMVFIDHGFQEAVFQEYHDPGLLDLKLEIYDQGNSANAESTYHDPVLEFGWEVPRDDFGAEGRVDTTGWVSCRAEFWREQYFTRCTVFEKSAYGLEALEVFCQLVDQKLMDKTVVDGLPASGEIPGWTRYMAASDSLGITYLMEGEADLFLEWGCSAGLKQDYYDSQFVLLQLELFAQETPANAQSLYHDSRLETGQEVARGDFGQEGRLDTTSSWTYGAQFWRDRYVVRLLVQEKSDSSLADLIRFCQLVDRNIMATSVEAEGSSLTTKPGHTELSQPFPNPFNDHVIIQYRIPEGWNDLRSYSVDIYNVSGQRIRRLVANQVPANGFYSLFWDGRDNRGDPVASGVYFCRFSCGPHERMTRLVLLR
jgi:hypothetical protein